MHFKANAMAIANNQVSGRVALGQVERTHIHLHPGKQVHQRLTTGHTIQGWSGPFISGNVRLGHRVEGGEEEG